MPLTKRSFYRLSKLHHPDHNQDDPHASRRFVRISEAYAILGQADKRALYDREHRHRLQQYRQEHHASASSSSSSSSITPRANSSYHSTGPAGGRPASGLSRRRTTFKGPPPSFYRQTGHHHASAGHTTSSSPNSSSSSSSHQHPFDARQNPHTPHFDRAANERTHQRLDARLARRRAEAAGVADLGTEASSEPSTLLGFLVVSAALVAGIVLPALVFGNSKTPPNPKSSDSQRTSQA